MTMKLRNFGLPFSRIPPHAKRVVWSVCVKHTKNGRELTTSLALNKAKEQVAKPPQWRIVDEFISPE